MSRGAKPGERKGGQQKRTPNRKTQAVIDQLEALGCDPIEGMAKVGMHETAELYCLAALHCEVVTQRHRFSYITP
jgi:hypothetical protein